MEKWQQHHNFFDLGYFSGEEKELVLSFLQFWRKEKAKIFYRVRKKNKKFQKKWRVKHRNKLINNTFDKLETASIEVFDNELEPSTTGSITTVPEFNYTERSIEKEIEQKVK